MKQDLEDALGLTPTQYSKAVGIFYLGYILFEIPSNMVLKKVAPRFWCGTKSSSPGELRSPAYPPCFAGSAAS